MLEICSDLSKTDLKIYYFCQHSKMAKWPKHFISGKQFQKRPNGNPANERQSKVNVLKTWKMLDRLEHLFLCGHKQQKRQQQQQQLISFIFFKTSQRQTFSKDWSEWLKKNREVYSIRFHTMRKNTTKLL
jgi:hypothetical protein